MKEFNYQRAWKEFVKPEFDKLSATIQGLLAQTRACVDSLAQNGNGLVGQTPELVAAFDTVPVEELAWASKVIYYYGHLASNRECQEGGLCWKFEKLADASIINRQKVDCSKPLSTPGLVAMHDSKSKMDEALEGFHDHKEGTEYDNDELPEFLTRLLPELAKVVEILKADYVNHKPHPFCIGPRHFPKDGGMFINPRQAPCAMRDCNLSYEKHTSDRALFVKPLTENEPDIKTALQKIIDTCKTLTIDIEGINIAKYNEHRKVVK